jgi:hypothetical protein
VAKRPIEEISRDPIPEANIKEGSVSFEGFILECSPTREPIILPTFSLVVESGSKGPSSQSRPSNEEVNIGIFETTSPAP